MEPLSQAPPRGEGAHDEELETRRVAAVWAALPTEQQEAREAEARATFAARCTPYVEPPVRTDLPPPAVAAYCKRAGIPRGSPEGARRLSRAMAEHAMAEPRKAGDPFAAMRFVFGNRKRKAPAGMRAGGQHRARSKVRRRAPRRTRRAVRLARAPDDPAPPQDPPAPSPAQRDHAAARSDGAS